MLSGSTGGAMLRRLSFVFMKHGVAGTAMRPDAQSFPGSQASRSEESEQLWPRPTSLEILTNDGRFVTSGVEDGEHVAGRTAGRVVMNDDRFAVGHEDSFNAPVCRVRTNPWSS